MEFGSFNLAHQSPAFSGDTSGSSLLYTVADHTDFSKVCADIGHVICNFFKEGLKVAGLCNRFNKLFCPEEYQNDVGQFNAQANEQLNKQLNQQFKEKLTGISSDPYVDQNKKVTANLYNRAQTLLVLNQIVKDVSQSKIGEKVRPELTMMVGLLQANKTEYLNIREKAKISLSFDNISAIFDQALAKEILPLREQWTATIVRDRKCDFHLQYLESAHEIMTFELAQGFKNKWKLGHLDATTYKAALGVATPYSAVGFSAGANVTGAREWLDFTDPEGYFNEYRLWYGGLSAEVEASIGKKAEKEVSIGEGLEVVLGAEASINGSASVQGLYGTFREPKTPLDLAIRDFKTLVKEELHSNNPQIAPYVARARLLDSNWDAKSAHGPDSELMAVLNELEDIEQLRLDYNAKKEGMDKRLSLYMAKPLLSSEIEFYDSICSKERALESREFTDKFLTELEKKHSDKPTFSAASLKVVSSEITEARIMGVVGKLSVGAEAKLSAKVKLGEGVGEKAPSIGAGLDFAVQGSGEAMLRFRDEEKRTLIGLRYMDQTKSETEKNSIREQVAEQFNVFKNTMTSSWRKEKTATKTVYTELGFDVMNWVEVIAPNKDNKKVCVDEKSQQEFLDFLKKNNLDQKLLRLIGMNDSQRQLFICKFPALIEKGKAADLVLIEQNFGTHFNYLKQDFREYTKLQASEVGFGRIFQTKKQKQKALREFEQRYGATTPEELIHRMQIASLYLLTNSDQTNEEFDEFSEGILKFEKLLANPLFEVDKKYLEEHLNFIEDLRITLFEAKFELGTKASAFVAMNSGIKNDEPNNEHVPVNTKLDLSVNAQFKLRARYSWLGGHLNKWRRGHGLLLSVTVGAGINVQAVIAAVAPDFQKNLPADFASYALAQLEEKLIGEIALAGSTTSERSFDFYLGKPDDYSFSHYYSRETQTEITDCSTKKAVPLGVVDFTFGGGRTTVKTDPLAEFCESNTLIQFFTLGTQQFHAAKMSKTTFNPAMGKDDVDTNEKDEEKQLQKKREAAAYKQFFINFANELNFKTDAEFDLNSDLRPDGDISKEIFQIEKGINTNDNYLKQLLFIHQNERRASSDATTIEFLTGRIKTIKTAIAEGKKSNSLNGDLEEFNFKIAKEKFKEAVRLFKDNPTDDSAYKNALNCFNKLIFVDYTQWIDCRSNSTDLKPRLIAKVDDAKTILTERILQAKASLAGIMMQHGSFAY